MWTYGLELWGTTSNSNIEILQRYQNNIIKLITQAPWFTKNTEVHEYLQMPTIREEIRTRSTKYCQRLTNHPNQLAKTLHRVQDTRQKTEKISYTRTIKPLVMYILGRRS